MGTTKKTKPSTKAKTKSPAKSGSSKPAFGSPEWQKKYGRGKKSKK